MSALLNTIPGDLPGLLRRGSPVIHAAFGAGVLRDPALSDCLFERGRAGSEPGRLLLDLTDPTGRAHAAWWVGARIDLTVWPIEPGSEDEARMLAQGGEDLTPTQIDTLARLVLRLAGRTP